MNKILLFLDSQQGDAVVCQVDGSEAEELLDECHREWEDWPEDLGIFDKGDGLYVWEGTITLSDCDGYQFKGTVRELNEDEQDRITKNVPIFG